MFFGNELEEKSFRVTGMLWYKSLLIVSCENFTKGYEIRIYSRDHKLDSSQVLYLEPFKNEISSMNLMDSHLLVYSQNCVMQSYLIYVVEGPKVVLQLRQAFSLQEFVGRDRECVQGIARLRPSLQNSIDDLFQSPILLLKNGFLYLIWKQESGWLATNLAEKVEHFWIAGSKVEDSDFQSSIWVFDGKGVKILSRPTALLESPVQNRKDTVFSMDLDFYPFVVLLAEGVLVGIKQYLSLNKSLNISQFGPEIKTHLFVHLILESFLVRGQTARALSFSRTYQNLGYFNHALEMMLHDALDRDSDKNPDSDQLQLPLIIQFVNQFPRSLEIMVNCARKSEMALWGYFFSIAGDPKELYQRSLESGALGVATSYLIIIQTLEPVQVSSTVCKVLTLVGCSVIGACFRLG